MIGLSWLGRLYTLSLPSLAAARNAQPEFERWMREQAAMDKIIDIARRDPNPRMREKALFWLGQSRDPRAAQVIREVIEQ